MNKIYIVEGNHDAARLKEIDPDMQVLITNGAAIEETLIKQIELLSKDHEIILFFDADNAGERLRRIISNRVKNVHQAFLTKAESLSKNQKKTGVEHASIDSIKKAINYKKTPKPYSDVTHTFLLDLNLLGETNAKKKRIFLCDELGIGYCNGKGLIKRLQLFGYQQKDILEVLNDYEQT